MRRAGAGTALLAAMAAAGCADDPLALESAPPMDTPRLEAAFLIGQSPLEPAGDPKLESSKAADGSVDRALRASFYVTPPETAEGETLLLRSSATFYGVVDPKNDPVAVIDPKDDPVAIIDPKNDPTRLMVVTLPIDDGSWAAIKSAAPGPDDKVDAVVTAELILVAKDGSETVLDAAKTQGLIDPKNDPAA